jgi:hypothetical protein
MSGIFRIAFRVQQRVQSPLGVLSGAAVAGGAILPAHVPSAGAVFAPSLRRFVSAQLFGSGPAFASVVVRVTLRPISIGSSNAYFNAAVDAGTGVAAGLFVNGSSFAAPRLTLRLSPVIFGGEAAVHPPAVAQTGVKGAPVVASGGAIHTPRVEGVHTFEVVGTLSVAGWAPRPASRRPRVAIWPNFAEGRGAAVAPDGRDAGGCACACARSDGAAAADGAGTAHARDETETGPPSRRGH